MPRTPAKVIQLKTKIETFNGEPISSRSNTFNNYDTNITPVETEMSDGYTSNDDLYPLRNEISPVLASAIRLLEEGVEILNDAMKSFLNEDLISSDDSVQRFQMLLTELFCCREIGDGFGLIISSIHHSISNSEENFINDNQLKAIQKCFNRIQSEPYISFDEAVDEIMKVEKVDLEVNPPHLKLFSGLLNE